MTYCHLYLPDNPSPGFSEPHWTCSRCGWVYKLVSDEPPRRNCPNAPDTRAALLHAQAMAVTKLGVSLEEVKHWGSHVVQWVALGCPTRTDEEVAERLAICHDDCEHFRVGTPPAADNPPNWAARIGAVAAWGPKKFIDWWRKNGYCKICGCGVSASKFPLWNMIRMAIPGLDCKEGKWDTITNRSTN